MADVIEMREILPTWIVGKDLQVMAEQATLLEPATKNTPAPAPRTAQARTLARFACDTSGFRRVKPDWMKVIDGGAFDGGEGIGT